MSQKRMTANPIKPARYRPGKAIVEERSSDDEEDYDDEGDYEEEDTQIEGAAPTAPPPKATSFPSDATKIASNLKKVDLNERKRIAAAEETARLAAEKVARAKEEEGFVTEESEEEEESDEGENDSGSEERSSEEEVPKVLLRPKFIKKEMRKEPSGIQDSKNEDDTWAEEEKRRKAKTDAMIQEQLEKVAAAQAAGKKDWDDDEDEGGDQVDDTDGLDPETERAAWKLRELKRVKREREAIEIAEKEREEIERRRNLDKDEREAEDRQFLEKQKEDRESKGKMGYMQKYFHKGAFFQDEAKAQGLSQRDIMGSRYQDDVINRELLPQYMQIRDMAKLGRKGRTKYKDLKTEDTGRWGIFDETRPRRPNGPTGPVDERFMPDRDRKGKGASGANTTDVRPRPKAPEGAPTGPRATIDAGGNKDGGKRYSPEREGRDRYLGEGRRHQQHSPRRRSYSRSLSPRRDWYRGRRKRSLSPYRDKERDRDRYRGGGDRGGGDKRRKVDVA